MKGLDLRKFKKVSSDDKQTVLKHPDGHTINIAHSQLKGQLKKDLEALPHYALGTPDGEIGSEQGGDSMSPEAPKIVAEESPQAIAPADASVSSGEHKWTADELAQIGQIGTQAAGSIKSDLGIAEPAPRPLENFQLPKQPETPETPSGPSPMEQAMQQQIGGIRGEAKAAGNLGKQQADIYAQNQQAQAAAHEEFQRDSKAVLDQYNAMVQDVKNGHIDPNRYMNSKSDLGKVSSAIGLLLSGLGSGLTGKENMAMAYLNKQIENDVEAQKFDMSNKNNIMHAMMVQYGNIKDAANMTKAFYAEQTADKIRETAARSSDPMAIARAQQAEGALKAQYAPIIQETMQRQALLKGAQKGTVPASQLVPHFVPEKEREAVFKEVERAENTAHSREAVLEAFDRAAEQYKTIGDRSGVKAFHSVMGPTFSDIEGTVRQSAMDLAFANMTPQALDSAKTIESKRQSVIDYMDSKSSAPRAEAYGIRLPKAEKKPTPRG